MSTKKIAFKQEYSLLPSNEVGVFNLACNNLLCECPFKTTPTCHTQCPHLRIADLRNPHEEVATFAILTCGSTTVKRQLTNSDAENSNPKI